MKKEDAVGLALRSLHRPQQNQGISLTYSL